MTHTNLNLPVIMYIHGFRSGANGSKRQQLQDHFEERYRVVTPEVDADPDKALAIINETITREKPQIIAGTSLGGWMTLMCDSGNAQLVVVNPCIDPLNDLAKWKDEELPYFCQRLDGVQTYTLTQDVLDKYAHYDLPSTITAKSNRTYALCTTQDELLGDSHIRLLTSIIPNDRMTITNDFGHRCSDAGMTHLFDIIDRIAVM
ncbi:MAG: hypothetical protein K2K52_01205 [Paramuribaculum sp.]|nr:hypothetical protein [Paramuribaculum sp.]